MYKVDYYTLAMCVDGSTGNIIQYTDVWYTEQKNRGNPKGITENN